MIERRLFGLGAIFGGLAVCTGAFAVHSLRARLSPEALAIFETGARYQMMHALALLATAWASTRWPGRCVAIAGGAFALGIVVFSGSLYALALTGVREFGALAPIGGALLIAGWVALVVTVVKR